MGIGKFIRLLPVRIPFIHLLQQGPNFFQLPCNPQKDLEFRGFPKQSLPPFLMASCSIAMPATQLWYPLEKDSQIEDPQTWSYIFY
jgi:hypothetical protein